MVNYVALPWVTGLAEPRKRRKKAPSLPYVAQKPRVVKLGGEGKEPKDVASAVSRLKMDIFNGLLYSGYAREEARAVLRFFNDHIARRIIESLGAG